MVTITDNAICLRKNWLFAAVSGGQCVSYKGYRSACHKIRFPIKTADTGHGQLLAVIRARGVNPVKVNRERGMNPVKVIQEGGESCQRPWVWFL